MSSQLPSKEFDTFFESHPDWDRDGVEIARTYVFADFNEALGFVVRIGVASEVADHHPDIDIRWNKVTIVLSTHSKGALTIKDLDLAATFDNIADQDPTLS